MERLLMRKIKDVLRLRASGYSTRKIAQSLGLCRGSARNYIQRAVEAGLSWPDVQDLDEGALERQLFRQIVCAEGHPFVMPDWGDINRELKRSGVTLRLLWEEYRACHPDDGYGYSAYCQHYRAWVKRLSPSMRQRHVAGEKLFVDYSGVRMEVTDPATGTRRPVELFVAVSRRRRAMPIGAPLVRRVRRITPVPRPVGARRCRTGSARMFAHLSFSVVPRH